MIIEISVAVIAVAFVFLVIYLIVLTNSLRITLTQVNEISQDLKKKSEAFNPLFNAINQTSQILERKATALKKDYDEKMESNLDDDLLEKKNLRIVAAVLELAGMGVSVWQKFKRGDK